MVDVNVQEYDSLMMAPTLNQTMEITRYARKKIYHGSLVRVEKSFSRDHCLASLGEVS